MEGSSESSSLTPYGEVLRYVAPYPHSGSALGFSKLILSLFSNAPFSYRECIEPLDSNNLDLALRVIIHFHKVGENEELVEVGTKIAKLSPQLCNLSERMMVAAMEPFTQEENK